MGRGRATIAAGLACLLFLATSGVAAQPEAAEEPARAPSGEPAPPRNEPAEDDPATGAATTDAADPEPPPGEGAPEPVEVEGEAPQSDDAGPTGYVLERVVVRGNTRTDTGLIRSYVPLRDGEALDPEDPRIEATRWRLLGTGWFDQVRLRIERGARYGHVLFVVEVRERNTFLIHGIALGFSEGVLNSDGPNTQLEPYFGISIGELNLFGTGLRLEATALLSVPQQGLRLHSDVTSLEGTEWGLGGTLFFNNGREFFGNDDVLIAADECPLESGLRCEERLHAVVHYRRYGGRIGTGHDLGISLRFTLDYQLEAVEVLDRPSAASHRRGTEIEPIDFAIHDGLSWISSLHLGLTHDERDDPGLPTQGRYVFLRADVSSTLIGSDYDFVRVQAGWREWFRLPEARHALRLGLFLGGGVGDVPFFYRFHVGDLSDLIPPRVLDLDLDRRAPPNVLDTSIREMRSQELAARFDIEYSLWLYEGSDALHGVQIYGLVGVYALMDGDDLRHAIPGYAGFARFPLDLTFDVGLRLDTTVGVFAVGFSTLLGFISL